MKDERKTKRELISELAEARQRVSALAGDRTQAGRVLGSTETISPYLIGHVGLLYEVALRQLVAGKVVREGTNGYTEHAMPACIIAVSAVEAYLNETFLSPVARRFLKGLGMDQVPRESIEKLDLGLKLILVPQLLFGRTFSRSSPPYQDMALLIKIRNDLVHYKMGFRPPRYLKDLEQRGIALGHPKGLSREERFPWTMRLSCPEGIRWAHNTVCETVQTLYGFVPDSVRRKGVDLGSSSNFVSIPDSYVTDWLARHARENGPAELDPPTPPASPT